MNGLNVTDLISDWFSNENTGCAALSIYISFLQLSHNWSQSRKAWFEVKTWSETWDTAWAVWGWRQDLSSRHRTTKILNEDKMRSRWEKDRAEMHWVNWWCGMPDLSGIQAQYDCTSNTDALSFRFHPVLIITLRLNSPSSASRGPPTQPQLSLVRYPLVKLTSTVQTALPSWARDSQILIIEPVSRWAMWVSHAGEPCGWRVMVSRRRMRVLDMARSRPACIHTRSTPVDRWSLW